MSIQSIIGGQAPALNVLSMIPPIFQRDVGLRPLLATALGLDDAERSSHQQDAVDGLPRRHRYRTACLTRIGPNREFLSDSDFLRVEHALRARCNNTQQTACIQRELRGQGDV